MCLCRGGGALNRHFCQTRVMPSFFFLGRCLSVHCRVVVRWLGSSFAVSVQLLMCRLWVAKKLKHRREGRKKLNLSWRGAGTLFCKLWSVLGLVLLANVCAFVCRLLMLIISLISFSTFPSLSFPWSVNL